MKAIRIFAYTFLLCLLNCSVQGSISGSEEIVPARDLKSGSGGSGGGGSGGGGSSGGSRGRGGLNNAGGSNDGDGSVGSEMSKGSTWVFIIVCSGALGVMSWLVCRQCKIK